MKTWIIAAFCLLTVYYGNAQNQVLRHFDPGNAGFLFPTGYALTVARFELHSPGWVKEIRVKSGGTSANGTFEMTLFGHEGGTAFPQLEKPLFPWVTVNKTTSGEEWLTYTLNNPIEILNNQFFVVFRNFTNGARIYAENKAAAASCKSSSGGDYYFVFVKTTSNTWAVGSRNALAVEAVMEYEPVPELPLFRNKTWEMGLDSNTGNSVIAWGDPDHDGFQDLLTASKLYRNEGGQHFKDMTQICRYSPSAGSMFVDLDNDGDQDILSFYSSGDSGMFYRNEGNFQFTKVKTTGLKSVPSLSSFSATDLDDDGYPEIFTGQLWGAYPEPYPNYLYKNSGNGTFTDITSKLYPNHDGKANFPQKTICLASDQNTWLSNGNTNRRSRGSCFADFDNDGDADLYITNYFLEPDEFFRNNGDGTFTDIISQKGIDRNLTGSNHGTGIDFGDYDNDGNLDILLPQFSHPAFALQYDHRNTAIYRNEGPPDYNFTDLNAKNEMVNPPSGLAYEETYAGGSWGDINNDGLQDFMMTVFYGCRYVKVFIQNKDHTFRLQTFDYGLEKLNTGEDVTWVDYDNDGRIDLCAGNQGRLRLFRNETTGNNHYISFDLKSTKGISTCIGSKVILYAGDQKMTRQITSGRGVRHQAPLRLHFGLGNRPVDKVEVYWPDHTVDTYIGFASDRNYTIIQGQPVEGLSEKDADLLLYGNGSREIDVHFVSKKRGSLELRLIDLTGRTVKTLVHQEMDAGGINIHVSGYSLASGMYLVEADFNGKKYARKWLNP